MTRVLPWLLGFVASATLAGAQTPAARPSPHIGYIYPAGGQAGAIVTITIGGQTLDAAASAVVTGGGLQARVIEYKRPLTQREFNALREQAEQLQQRRAAARRAPAKAKAAAEAPGSPAPWTPADEKMLAELRQKLAANRPNRQANPAIAETLAVEIAIEPGAAAGEREIRVRTPNGLSNPMAFHVGELPEITAPPAAPSNPNAAAAAVRRSEPLQVVLPVIVNGQIMPGEVDRFRFTAQRGQRLVVAASARALVPYLADAVPGWFQATLAIYDANGRELEYADDFRYDPDPVLACELPRDGDYVVEIKDAIFRGREDFVYRIAIGELPYITTIFPLGGRAGVRTSVEVAGWNLPAATLAVDAPANGGAVLLATRGAAQRSNLVPFDVSTREPETLEHEPNHSTECAQLLGPAAIVNGRIDAANDIDVFRIEGRRGREIVAEVLARRLHSPLDATIAVFDANGQQLAANDDCEDKREGLMTHHADSRVSFTPSADGACFIQLRDAQRHGGADYAYRLRVGPPRPDFELRVTPASVTLRGGACAPITVYAFRHDGFTGEIALALREAPPGFALEGGRIPAGQDSVRLTLRAPAVTTAAMFDLQLEGRGTIGGESLVRRATPAEDMMQAFAYHHLVPAQAWKIDVAPGRLNLRAPPRILGASPLRLPLGGAAILRVQFPGAAAGARRLEFELSEPPAGVSVRRVTSTPAGAEIELACDRETATCGLQGNLILQAFVERDADEKSKAKNARRTALGVLPAAPFEIVAPKS